MTDQPTPLDQMLSIYGVNAGRGQFGPSMVNLSDPGTIDWNALQAQYSLTPEEVQQLQVPSVSQGPSLAQRLQAMRPQARIGNLTLSTNGQRVQGRMKF